MSSKILEKYLFLNQGQIDQGPKIKEEIPDQDDFMDGNQSDGNDEDQDPTYIDPSDIKCEQSVEEKTDIAEFKKVPKEKRKVQDSDRTYSCTICKITFQYKKNYKSHITEMQDGKKVLKCCGCDLKFSSFNGAYKLLRHIATVHDGKKHNCTSCAACFEEKEDLLDHELTFHEKNSKISKNEDDTEEIENLKVS